jgi:hypothetical protein
VAKIAFRLPERSFFSHCSHGFCGFFFLLYQPQSANFGSTLNGHAGFLARACFFKRFAAKIAFCLPKGSFGCYLVDLHFFLI